MELYFLTSLSHDPVITIPDYMNYNNIHGTVPGVTTVLSGVSENVKMSVVVVVTDTTTGD